MSSQRQGAIPYGDAYQAMRAATERLLVAVERSSSGGDAHQELNKQATIADLERQLADPAYFKRVLEPGYWTRWPWQKRREFLADMHKLGATCDPPRPGFRLGVSVLAYRRIVAPHKLYPWADHLSAAV